jgi:hypothetical protein
MAVALLLALVLLPVQLNRLSEPKATGCSPSSDTSTIYSASVLSTPPSSSNSANAKEGLVLISWKLPKGQVGVLESDPASVEEAEEELGVEEPEVSFFGGRCEGIVTRVLTQ